MSRTRKPSSYTPSKEVDIEVRILEAETASTPEPEISEDVQDAPNQDAPTPAADDNTAPEPQPKKRGSGKGFLKAIVLLLHTACLTLGATSAWAQIYVDSSATGSNNGTSWANAYTKLQDALAAAGSGSQIWVANGTYYPDEGTGQTNNAKLSTFQLVSGAALYGGFGGGESSVGERDVAANETILSGDIDQDGTLTGNAYHVVTGNGTNNSTLLDGFTITGGNASFAPDHRDGGGIFIYEGSPTISSCTITGNHVFGYGGGVYIDGESGSPATVTITNSTISDNVSEISGAILVDSYGHAIIERSTISNNDSFYGGGIRTFVLSSLTVIGSTVSGNTADYAAAIDIVSADLAIITGSTIFGNTARASVGGINATLATTDARVRSTILWGNSDPGGMDATAQIDGPWTVSYSIVQGGLPGGTTNGGNNSEADPLLWPLQDNGGPTQTHLPAIGSPVVDIGSCFSQTVDQRGEARPYDADDAIFQDADDACDIGSVEVQSDGLLPTCSGVCYVDASATGTGDGTTWANAIIKLQTALAWVSSGDQIWVAGGNYYTDEGVGQTNDDRASTFQLIDGVAIYGGFAGTETTLGERNVADNVSLLSGDLLQDDDGGYNSKYAENSYHVVTGSGTNASAVLDGFQIQGGNADGVGDDGNGAGVFIIGGSPTIANNNIAVNVASGLGGGIYTEDGSSPIIKKNRFRSNEALSGGGIANSNSSPEIINNSIEANEATSFGGGIYNELGSNAVITSNTIYANVSSNDGGGIRNSFSTAQITNTILWGNTDVGGINAEAQISNASSAPTVSYSTVQGGLSSGSVDGGNNLTDDPLLVDYGTFGGSIRLYRPDPTSPVIDAGTCLGGTVTEDARGKSRPYDADDGPFPNVDDGCDIGAFEMQADEVLDVTCDGICYVDASASGSETGESWSNAFTDLQTALFLAGPGDEIWVAQGTYFPDEGMRQVSDTVTSTFRLESGVAVYGGFAGGETGLLQRDIASNPTILSGDVDQSGTLTGNAYHVVTSGGTDGTALLDGFTITDGNANGSAPNDRGAGIYNHGGSPTITNSTITGNEASLHGGGMFNQSSSSPTISGSTFSANSAANGGAMFNDSGSGPTISGSTFSANSAANGGAILNGFCSGNNPVITGTTISGNTSTANGGGLSNQSCSPVITSTILWGNSDLGGTDATAQIYNTTSAAPNVSYSIVQGGLSTDTQDGGNNLVSDPLIGVLQDNGGPTPTMLPASASPAIDAGTCGGQIVDQRGETRPYDDAGSTNVDDGCDIGAVEVQSADLQGITCSGVCFVDAAATGTGSGESWDDAIPLLQDALAAVGVGDEIWVAQGTYYPDDGFDEIGDDRTSTFMLKNGVTLYGGFAGSETTLGERDVAANPVILSGDLMQDDNTTGNAENAYHVVTGSGTDSTAVLDGFTVTAGNADGSSPNDQGAGIYNNAGSPTIRNSIISENNAAGAGGGIYNLGSSPSVSSSTIIGNSAASGGAMANSNGSAPVIANSTITGNSVTSNGGGIVNLLCTDGPPIIRGSTVVDNSASADGGGIASAFCSPVVTSTILWDNSDAGGMDASAQIYNITTATPTVSYSIVQDALSTNTVDGGNNLFIDPMLGALADNGGSTWTMLPSPVSSAVDAGTCGGLTTDQRGEVRPFDSVGAANTDDGCDIGAVELQAGELLNITCSGICYVDAAATGTGSGESWDDAIVRLQDALQVVVAGDTIWVAAATYYPDEGLQQTEDDFTSTFQLKSDVALYGGFAGGEAGLGDRDVAAHPAILSGDIDQSGTPSGNAYHVVTTSGTDSTALLDGFTITAGNANGGGNDNLGGGIYNNGGSPTIANTTVSGNTALSNGGGFYSNNGSPTIANTTITDNTASLGGGIASTLGAPTILNSTIFLNSATSNGGGIYNSGASSTIANTTIFDNTATSNGGGIYNVFGLPVIRSTILWNNHDAGGTDASAQIANNLSTPTVSFSIVQASGGSASWESGLGTDGGNNIDDDPLLGSLQDNGGPTQTMLPDSGSAAIDNGTCLSGAVTTDQRGKARPYDFAGVSNADDGCDIGAVEVRDDSLTGGLILHAAVLLQGPYLGAGMMSDGLSASVPLNQPYADAIYDGTSVEYDGTESVVSLPDSVVDWVLVNLRSGVGPETKVYETPAFLKQEGEIVGLDGGPLELSIPEADYYVVVRHRNHLAVMSSSPVSFAGGIGTWDARTSLAASYTTGPTPVKNLTDGHFGMFAADGNADGQATAPDFNLWNAATTAGATGYEPADYNMDGQVTAPDFNLWNANTTAGATSRVPD